MTELVFSLIAVLVSVAALVATSIQNKKVHGRYFPPGAKRVKCKHEDVDGTKWTRTFTPDHRKFLQCTKCGKRWRVA